jgi:glutathione S-transferase
MVFDDFTIPDIYFLCCFRRANQLQLDVSMHENCNSHFARVADRDKVNQSVAFEKKALASYSAK